MNLKNLAQDRDNNFNLIRILAALAVLVSHSVDLLPASSGGEGLRRLMNLLQMHTNLSFGSIAVDVFFVTSGFLVTRSLLVRKSAIDFILARILRIYPALIVMVIITVFVLGTFFTAIPLPTYLTHPQTYHYLKKCITLYGGVAYKLPGVFEQNFYKGAVNGSLWTMPKEIKMYSILIFIWLGLSYTKNKLNIFKILIVSSALIAGVLEVMHHFQQDNVNQFTRLFFMFFSGSACYVLKDRIAFSHVAFWMILVLMLTASVINIHVFFVIYKLTIAYVLLYLAYIPAGLIRSYNRLGDYSYGLYIYAFPVQQSISAIFPQSSVYLMIIISFFISLTLAIFSWHFVEKRALGLKELYSELTRKILTPFQSNSN